MALQTILQPIRAAAGVWAVDPASQKYALFAASSLPPHFFSNRTRSPDSTHALCGAGNRKSRFPQWVGRLSTFRT